MVPVLVVDETSMARIMAMLGYYDESIDALYITRPNNDSATHIVHIESESHSKAFICVPHAIKDTVIGNISEFHNEGSWLPATLTFCPTNSEVDWLILEAWDTGAEESKAPGLFQVENHTTRERSFYYVSLDGVWANIPEELIYDVIQYSEEYYLRRRERELLGEGQEVPPES